MIEYLREKETLTALLNDMSPLTLPLFKMLQSFNIGSLPGRPII